MVLLLKNGAARLVWAGSISGDIERDLVMQYGADLQAGVLVQGPAKRGEANLTQEWLDAVEPKLVVRWSRVLEEDTSLSVDFAEQAWMEGIELWKTDEKGCVFLKPDSRNGDWVTRAWRR